MDNTSLCRLIREALHSPEGAEVLALAIDHLPEIKRYLGEAWLPYYEQALPSTERDVRRNINRFPQMKSLNLEATDCQNPADATNVRVKFISWVMIILKRDCQDAMRIFNRRESVSLSISLGIEKATMEDGIEALIVDEPKEIFRQLSRYIKEDNEGKLRNYHPRNRPDCNCQVLLQKLFLDDPPNTIREISQELNVSSQTLYSQWKRTCLPLIREVAISLGYDQIN